MFSNLATDPNQVTVTGPPETQVEYRARMTAYYNALGAIESGSFDIHISGVFLDDDGFKRSVTVTAGVFRETIYVMSSEYPGLYTRVLRERDLQGRFNLWTCAAASADVAVYYGSVSIESYPSLSVKGVVTSDLNSGVFHRWSGPTLNC